MDSWHTISKDLDLSTIDELSKNQYCLIFKHSTRCSISTIAQSRLEKNWDIDDAVIRPYYLDLIQYRNISNLIGTKYDVTHQSPQVLLIKDGISIYDSSHLDINVDNIKSMIQ